MNRNALFLPLSCFVLIALTHPAQAQVGHVSYFLKSPDVIVRLKPPPLQMPEAAAKVRVLQVAFTDNRDRQKGPNKNPYIAEVEIVDVLRGEIEKGTKLFVGFGTRDQQQRFTFPATQEMRAQEYLSCFALTGIVILSL